MDNSERKITLRIADMVLPLRINSEKQEELYRKAAKRINDKLNAYRSRFSNDAVGKDKILAMVTIDFAYTALSLEDRNDTEPFTEKIESLNAELKALLDKEEV